MEGWRLIAAVLLGTGGLILMVFAMAKDRDYRGANGGHVAITGAVAFTVTAVLTVLVATALPASVAWSLVGLVGVVVSVLLLTG
jgi:hypothetical protein